MKPPTHLAAPLAISLATTLLAICIPALAAPPPGDFSASVAHPATWQASAYRGETVAISAQLTGSDGKPFPVPEGANASMLWSTNGVDWFEPRPATVTTGGLIRATWTPDMDCGADSYRIFLRVDDGGTSNVNYRANMLLRLLGSPGAVPSELPLPAKTIDFSTVVVSNAPWIEEETDPTVPAWAKAPAPPEIPPETDPVFAAASNRFLVAETDPVFAAASNRFLVAETDPIWDAWLATNSTLRLAGPAEDWGGWAESSYVELSAGGGDGPFLRSVARREWDEPVWGEDAWEPAGTVRVVSCSATTNRLPPSSGTLALREDVAAALDSYSATNGYLSAHQSLAPATNYTDAAVAALRGKVGEYLPLVAADLWPTRFHDMRGDPATAAAANTNGDAVAVADYGWVQDTSVGGTLPSGTYRGTSTSTNFYAITPNGSRWEASGVGWAANYGVAYRLPHQAASVQVGGGLTYPVLYFYNIGTNNTQNAKPFIRTPKLEHGLWTFSFGARPTTSSPANNLGELMLQVAYTDGVPEDGDWHNVEEYPLPVSNTNYWFTSVVTNIAVTYARILRTERYNASTSILNGFVGIDDICATPAPVYDALDRLAARPGGQSATLAGAVFDFAELRGIYAAVSNIVSALGGTVTNYPSAANQEE